MNTTLPLTLNYDFSPNTVLYDPDFGHKLDRMRAAGVSSVWLGGFFYGRWEASPEDIARAKTRLEEEGLYVGALSIPLGHGGQAFDPSKPAESKTGDGWQPRVDAAGNPWPNTSCPRHAKVLADSRAAGDLLKQLGFSHLVYDDDLRVGAWGPAVQGCFCDDCMNSFRAAYPAYGDITRAELAARLAAGDAALTDAWETFQCDSILQFLEQATPEGVIPCPMVMHNGDRRHGLDIRHIRARFPDAIVRVGEGHFSDESFLHPVGRAAIAASIRRHMTLIGSPEYAFSETTTYPVGALSPENFVEKMRLEIDCGLRNIFLMSGTVFLPDPYWEAIAAALPELRERAARTPLPDLSEPMPEFIWQI